MRKSEHLVGLSLSHIFNVVILTATCFGLKGSSSPG